MPSDATQPLQNLSAAWRRLRIRTWTANIGIVLGVVAFSAALLFASVTWFLLWMLAGGVVIAAVAWPALRLVRAGFVSEDGSEWSAGATATGIRIARETSSLDIPWGEIKEASVCDTTLQWPGISGLEPSATILLKSGTVLGVPAWSEGYSEFVRQLELQAAAMCVLVPPPFYLGDE